jgi:MFS transporter, MHS family, proline/betaine transporter
MASTASEWTPAPTHEPAPPISADARRRALRASVVGTVVEYYEFTVYAFLAVVFGPLFFPASSAAASTLSALAVFGAGYLARPLGGILFGVLGDRFGRRPVLMTTLVTMGLTSSAIGLLPTYATLGLAAPAVLVVLRLVQGLSAGGEFAGAMTYVAEMAPPRRRGLYAAVPGMGIGLGFASAALVVAAVSASGTDMATWGWRLPFLLCLPLTALCLLLRRRLEDSPEFAAIAASREGVANTPVRDVLRDSWRDILRVTFLTVGVLGPGILGKLYIGIYLVQERGLAPVAVYTTLGVSLLLVAGILPLMGLRSDTRGRRPIALAGLGAAVLLPVPLFLLASRAESIWAIAPALVVYLAVEPFASGAVYGHLAELFPARTRFTGTAIGINLGTIVTAGFGPAIATLLVTSTGWAGAAGLWGSACAVTGIVAVLLTPDLSNQALRR